MKLRGLPLEFGVRLPNSGPLASAASILSSAQLAEQLGYDSVWVHDHIVWGTEEHHSHLSAGSAQALRSEQLPNFYESLTTLAALAGRTDHVKLGVAVVVLPLRNPVVFAKQTSTIDVISNGRLILGVAAGAPRITEKEFEAVGVEYHKRGKILDDYIKALKTLWVDPMSTYHGEFVSFKDVQMFPKPLQKPHPPILIGGGERGLSEVAMNRVLALGDGWIPAYLTESELESGTKSLEVGKKRAGRDDDKFIVGMEAFTGLSESEYAAKQVYSETLMKNFTSLDEGLKRSLVGRSENVIRRLEAYRRVGLDFVELKFVYSTLPEFHGVMRAFAKDIIPSFR